MRSAYLRRSVTSLLSRLSAGMMNWQMGEFCAGPDSYTWWQADPWAGKSALASWFVLHPPAGVDIVSFFITGRLIGEADSDAFLKAMTEQLDSLYPLAGIASCSGGRAGAWWDLLASAAAEAEERYGGWLS